MIELIPKSHRIRAQPYRHHGSHRTIRGKDQTHSYAIALDFARPRTGTPNVLSTPAGFIICPHGTRHRLTSPSESRSSFRARERQYTKAGSSETEDRSAPSRTLNVLFNTPVHSTITYPVFTSAHSIAFFRYRTIGRQAIVASTHSATRHACYNS